MCSSIWTLICSHPSDWYRSERRVKHNYLTCQGSVPRSWSTPEPGDELGRHFQGWCSADLDLSDSALNQEGVGPDVECFLGAQWHFARQLRVWGGAQGLWEWDPWCSGCLTFRQWARGCRTVYSDRGVGVKWTYLNSTAQEPFLTRTILIQTFLWGSSHVTGTHYEVWMGLIPSSATRVGMWLSQAHSSGPRDWFREGTCARLGSEHKLQDFCGCLP